MNKNGKFPKYYKAESNFNLYELLMTSRLTLRKKNIQEEINSRRKKHINKKYEDSIRSREQIQNLYQEFLLITNNPNSTDLELNKILQKLFDYSIDIGNQEDFLFLLQNNILDKLKQLCYSNKCDINLIFAIIINLFSSSKEEIHQYDSAILETNFLNFLYGSLTGSYDEETKSSILWVLSNILDDEPEKIYTFFVQEGRFIYATLNLFNPQFQGTIDMDLLTQVTKFLYSMTKINFENHNNDKFNFDIIKDIFGYLISIFTQTKSNNLNILKNALSGITNIIENNLFYYDIISRDLSEINEDFIKKILVMELKENDEQYLFYLEKVANFFIVFCINIQGNNRIKELLNLGYINYFGVVFGFLFKIEEMNKNLKEKITNIKCNFLCVILYILESSEDLLLKVVSTNVLRYIHYLILNETSEKIFYALTSIIYQINNYSNKAAMNLLLNYDIYSILFSQFAEHPYNNNDIIKKLYVIYEYISKTFQGDIVDLKVSDTLNYFEEKIIPNFEYPQDN